MDPLHERLAGRPGGHALSRPFTGGRPGLRGARPNQCAPLTAPHLHRWPLQMRQVKEWNCNRMLVLEIKFEELIKYE